MLDIVVCRYICSLQCFLLSAQWLVCVCFLDSIDRSLAVLAPIYIFLKRRTFSTLSITDIVEALFLHLKEGIFTQHHDMKALGAELYHTEENLTDNNK